MEKLDLVYILGSGSTWHNNEIRYSLRSVEKYFDFGKVFVIGEFPGWLQGAIHIPVEDKRSNKIMNATVKYLAACKAKEISNDFVLMNDDFFFLKPVKKIPNYSRGMLDKMITRHETKGGYYYASLVNTSSRLKRLGIQEPIDFEIHGPMVFSKQKLQEAINIMGSDMAYSMRSSYGNLFNLQPKKVIDFKAAGLAELAFQMLKPREFLSVSDGMVVRDEFRTFMERKFPKHSRFEADKGMGAFLRPGQPVGKLRHYATTTFTHGKRTYTPGEIVSKVDADGIKNNPRMKYLIELK